MCCRLGEASNPGPASEYEMGLQIGCINPTGLMGRTTTINALPRQPHTIWAVSETHLTKAGQSKFAKELVASKSCYRMQMGTPVPPRSHTLSAIGGKQRGVGFLTTAPTRALTHSWGDDLNQLNRIHASAFQVGNRTITGGVLYGFAVHSETLHTKQQTDKLAQALTERLIHQGCGLRFIAGDFNQSENGIKNMEEWEDKGWVNLQRWANQNLGRPVQNTCKGVNVRDHVYVSPELALYLKDVHVQDDWFSDHAILYAELHPLGRPPLIPLWRMPQPLPWKEQPVLPSRNFQVHPDATPTEQYAQICTELEQRMHLALKQKGQHLPSSAKGRAKTREVRMVQEFSAPPSRAREGELQPAFHGTNLAHVQWLRQCRRLANYLRLTENMSNTPTAVEHRSQLWQSIRKGTGFKPSFAKWWEQQAESQGRPVPIVPPPARAAKFIHEAFLAKFQQLEKELLKSRITMAKQRRHDDPNVIFRDLKADAPAPLQMLMHTKQATIQLVDHDQQAVEVEPNHNWDPSQPILVDDQPLQTIHVEPDKIWAHQVDQFLPGQRVVQQELIGDLTSLFHEFGKEWKKRWDKHQELPEHAWDPVISFIHDSFPDVHPMQYRKITYEEWIESLRRKPARAATGPDAVTRADLLHMPQDLVEQLLELLHTAEQTGQWPVQLLEGFVTALEKSAGAQNVQAFRPITVFPVCYRNWSSIRSRQILRHLSSFAPPTCQGNLPGRSASKIWMGILDEIEFAQLNHTSLSGGVIDLVKAYNTLPRVPVFHIMAKMGVPPEILRAWSAATTTMSRRFKLRNAVGPPLKSTTGYPEGCGLSCAAMLGINFLCHQWVTVNHPTLTLWSYVDNIEVTGPSAASVEEGMAGLREVCTLLDVQIDAEKSYAWSVNQHERKRLKTSFPTKLAARDLGGHIQYCRQVTNFTITSKLDKAEQLWNRLARSLAPYKSKLRAIKAKAWPGFLHGISSVHLADDHMGKLRTGALKGLGEHKPGTSPLAHLSLVEQPMSDPQCFALVQTIISFREVCTEVDFFVQAMMDFHQPTRVYVPRPGPLSVLLTRLHQVAWSWSHNTVFLDQTGQPCDILRAPVQEIKQRLVQAWQDRVKAVLATRKTMQGMQHMSPQLTTAKLHTMSAEDQALLRTALNGTFFTADRLEHHHGDKDTTCMYCHRPDSQVHRHWHCEAFQTCRSVSAAQSQRIAEMAPCVSAHGWVPEPPSLQQFKASCMSVDPAVDVFAFPSNLPAHLHVFTDGGCKAPTCPVSKWAAWGVLLATEEGQHWPLASGLLSGWLQTSLRAEITAAISACCVGLQTQTPLTLWTDNDLVYRRLKQFKSHTRWIKPNQKDGDLWQLLQAHVHALGPLFRNACKVVSHQDPMLAENELEEWAFRANNAVDALVNHEYGNHPSLMACWTQLQQDLHDVTVLRDCLHSTMVKVGKQAVQRQAPVSQLDAPLPEPRLKLEDMHEVQIQHFSPDDLPKRYVFDDVHIIIQWVHKLRDPHAELRILSWFQLNALFEHITGMRGVHYIKNRKQWINAKDLRDKPNFAKRANSLSRYLQAVIEHTNGSCKPIHLRPSSAHITFWTQCIALRLAESLWKAAEELLAAQQPRFTSVGAFRGFG